MYSVKMMPQLRGGIPLLSREYKCLYSKILSRISPCGYVYVDDGLAKRHYSAVTKCGTRTLQMKKLQNSSLLMTNSRNFHYNIFTGLVDLMEGQFLLVHDYTGLPWWAVIVVCTLPFRYALAYLIHKNRISQKYKSMHIYQNLLPKCMSKEKVNLRQPKYGHFTVNDRKQYLQQMELNHQARLCEEHGVVPLRDLCFALLPLPYWIANSVALRQLSGANVLGFLGGGNAAMSDSMHYEGLFWFKDLCVADPYHILPVAVGAIYFFSNEISVLSNPNYGKPERLKAYSLKYERIMKVARGLTTFWCLFSVCIFWNSPSAMVYYWFISGLFSLLIRLSLMHPSFEQRYVPDNVHVIQDKDPYGTLYNNMKKRYRLWFLK